LGAPTYDELAALARAQAALIEVQEAHIESLRARVVALEARVLKNSRNSSKPPSSDGPAKSAARKRSLRERSGRAPGGQVGHEGAALAQAAEPDAVVDHFPVECPECGGELGVGAQVVSVQRRQVFELPEIRAVVTEHRVVKVRCSCGGEASGEAPAGVVAPVQYGPRLRAAVLYLYQAQFCSKRRAAQTAADLFGVALSAGSVSNFQAVADRELDEFTAWAKEAVSGAGVVGADETGERVAGAGAWLHVARTGAVSVLEVNKRRGAAAMREIGVVDGYRGVLVRDALASYDAVAPDAEHALCGAHLLRELNAVSEFLARYPEHRGHPGWDWAEQAARALLDVKTARDRSPAQVCPPGPLARARNLITSAAVIAQHGGLPPPGPVGASHRALARRIAARIDDYLRFASDPLVPFDNNGSERDLRMAKLRMKVSGGFRSAQGANRFARLRSYTATAQKNQTNVYQAILSLFQHQPWLPTTT
jgi:transposase